MRQPFRKALAERNSGKALIFDSGPIISLVMNNCGWILRPLSKRYNGNFYITREVQNELIDKPLNSKRFKFEAMYIKEFLDSGSLKLIDDNADVETNRLLRLANSIFRADKEDLRIIQRGEIESLAFLKKMHADGLVVDERTLRMLIEEPLQLRKLLTKKLYKNVTINRSNLRQFQKLIGDVKIIRSSELCVIAFELGLMDKYADGSKRELLDGLLWGVKLRGCSISNKEIERVIKLEGY